MDEVHELSMDEVCGAEARDEGAGLSMVQDAFDLASDQNRAAWVTQGGKRLAAIVPVDVLERELADMANVAQILRNAGLPPLRPIQQRLHEARDAMGDAVIDSMYEMVPTGPRGDLAPARPPLGPIASMLAPRPPVDPPRLSSVQVVCEGSSAHEVEQEAIDQARMFFGPDYRLTIRDGWSATRSPDGRWHASPTVYGAKLVRSHCNYCLAPITQAMDGAWLATEQILPRACHQNSGGHAPVGLGSAAGGQ